VSQSGQRIVYIKLLYYYHAIKQIIRLLK